ncbi:hypothetical protein PINS_up008784 [Pythium insidiosum]|nr:hypothetical protein PINS_up008784 [Pythium insidiosum]
MELTEDLIKRRSKHFDLSCITHLDLSSAGLRRLAHLDGCKSLLHLDLTGNQLSDLSGLPALPQLQSLNLSRNNLRTLADLPQLSALEELMIKDNQLASVDFQALARCAPCLRHLRLDGNPAVVTASTLAQLRTAFPRLVLFNGESLDLFEVLHTSVHEKRVPQNDATAVRSVPKATTAFQVPTLDLEAFVAATTQRLEGGMSSKLTISGVAAEYL